MQNCYIYQYKNQLVFATEKGLYKFNEDNETFEPEKNFLFADSALRVERVAAGRAHHAEADFFGLYGGCSM